MCELKLKQTNIYINFVLSMNRSKKNGTLFLILALVLFLSFYRDYVFRSINALLQAWDYDMDYPIHPSLSFLKNYDYDTVTNLKWVLTIVFSGLFLIILLLVLKILFNNKKYRTISIFLYATIMVISAIFMGIGYFFENTSERMYELSRFLMGLEQSPFMMMILIPIFMFAEKENLNNKA